MYCHADYEEQTPWGFARVGVHRRAVVAAALRDLSRQLGGLGSRLVECCGPPGQVLPALAQAVGASAVFCEDIAAPYEQAEVAELRSAGLQVQTVWQSSLIDPLALPWPVQSLPAVFTTFRQAIEQARIAPSTPLPPPAGLPPWPAGVVIPPGLQRKSAHVANETLPADSRASFPYGRPEFDGGETAGLRHLATYLQRKLPHTYKRTRNALAGVDFSSKWSPWLATGALSPRRVMAELQQFEQLHGQSDGSYWLWFELLWRDYFRFLHLQHGARLYRARGLADARQNPERPDAQGFERWRHASTGEPLVDAAMRELEATGYLSNRLRQVVASYLVHELKGDWRAGAAWFESQLVDYDVYSNQGNWLYIAGRGTDPRGGRRFNVRKQASEYDPDGAYLRLWAAG
ncbi:Cryptochrome DASH [Ralstonia sp. LMG 32965]|uniref:Cryptochrome DASH n=1 Tax=Ralstonia flatus TaxID=3058601 RepID=A0AAD2BZ50_9RALS|nr:Cryptochrome DASH [Ralstonia sp. LMG 32965]CAJ0879359.1 Cryptochrome DASH [Ralstonia sp. LMG 32965]